MIKVTVEKLNEVYYGKRTGNYVWHVLEVSPTSGLLKGRPLGRGYSENEALQDFCHRANADGNETQLQVRNLMIVRRRMATMG